MKTKSLYIHIPFCNSICSYCDFCKVYYTKDVVDNYLHRLQVEVEQLNIEKPLETIYIGGGTPSSLHHQQMIILMEMIQPYIGKDTIEVCIEVNPESMDDKKLEILKQGNINRLSIGVQTFNQEILRLIERHHTNSQVIDLVERAIHIGISNISIDLMYGLPKQTKEDIQKDLQIVATLPIQHISYYALILEEHTLLKNSKYQPLSEQVERDINEVIDSQLEELNFIKYEVSNYAKEGYASRHNLTYWKYDNYYGVGIGASAKIDNAIISHSRNLHAYLQNKDITKIEEISNEDSVFNHIMMSMRLLEGVDCKTIEQRYQVDILKKYEEVIDTYKNMGMLEVMDGKLKCNKNSIHFLNSILVDFLP